MIRKRLLVLHEPAALAALQAIADEQRLARDNARWLWLNETITGEQLCRVLASIDARESAEQG